MGIAYLPSQVWRGLLRVAVGRERSDVTAHPVGYGEGGGGKAAAVRHDGDVFAALLPLLWGRLLGEGDDMSCDAGGGWGSLPPVSVALPTPRGPPHRVVEGMSDAERASGCNASSVACVVMVAQYRKGAGGELDAAATEQARVQLRRGLDRRVPLLTYHRKRQYAPSVRDLLLEPNVGHEHAVYLRYIVAFYHALPPISIFLHGHRQSWHEAPTSAIVKLAQIRIEELSGSSDVYRSLNAHRNCVKEPDRDGGWSKELAAQAPPSIE